VGQECELRVEQHGVQDLSKRERERERERAWSVELPVFVGCWIFAQAGGEF